MTRNLVVCLSDVSIGYGSPQIPKLVEFLSENYDANSVIVQPYDALKAEKEPFTKNLTLRTIPLSSHPHTRTGRKEFLKKASEIVEQLKPDVLIICGTFSLPILFQINSKPKFVIYYYLESIITYGRCDIEMNKEIAQKVDLIIFTEENRAVKFGELCGFQNIPFCVIYNCVNDSNTELIPLDKRNGRIIYQGTISKDTAINYYFNKKIQSFPIDLYGNIHKTKYGKKLLSLHDNVKYGGYIDSEKLSQLRKFYTYGIVIWLPVSQNNLYASPNKFFELIASGVPPIAAPHPQCKMLIKRYDCGLIMQDWDFNSFYQLIRLAMDYYKTKEYEKMVNNCLKAVREELNWDTQMKKLKPFLK